eukprot:gene8150-2823_t
MKRHNKESEEHLTERLHKPPTRNGCQPEAADAHGYMMGGIGEKRNPP